MNGLMQFQRFDLAGFLKDKTLSYVKAGDWKDGDVNLGSKVVVQIVEDRTQYSKPGVNNFGELLSVKIRGIAPSAFAQLRPLSTEVVIKDVERATVYGEYKSSLAIIAKIAVKDAPAKQ